MKNQAAIFILLLLSFKMSYAQEDSANYYPGYALRGADTIKCKILDQRKTGFYESVTLLIGQDKISFPVNSAIIGFGFVAGDVEYHVGVIHAEIRVGTRLVRQPVFARKLVAGIIDFYEYTYQIRTTKTTTVNGVETGTPSTSNSRITNYYISKQDPSNKSLSTVQLLFMFRKKELSPYLSDNPELLNKADKKFNLYELIAVLKQYNEWYLRKSTQ